MTQAINVFCKVCGKLHIVIVPTAGYKLWSSGQARIQDALPQLTDDERELLLSGICPHCWDKLLN